MILIVDDEADLAGLLDFNLRQAGHETAVAENGERALALAQAKQPDLVLLDVMLPDISGREVCRRLKATPGLTDVPVLMLTARGEEHERVSGFEAGADDYVTKPFSVQELLLRVKAVLRRSASKGASAHQKLTVGRLSLDLTAHRAYADDDELLLTALEFRLLKELMVQRGRVLTRQALLKDVWGLSSELETRTVDTHVMRLRDKLGPARDQVETVRGVGYRMADLPPAKDTPKQKKRKET